MAVMSKNAKQSMTIVYLLLRFYPALLSKLDLIIISFFLIQNKLSIEWSTIIVLDIFLYELEEKKDLNERNQCSFGSWNLHMNRYLRPGILQTPISKFRTPT